MYDKAKYTKTKRVQTAVALAILSFAFLSLSVLYLAGCTDTLDGEVYENQKPIVYFANIPPDGQRFSRNPVIYWYGTDRDGLIDYYRYHVVAVTEVGSDAPEDYILNVDDTDWIYVDVDPALSNPHTENVIPMSADLGDPVNTFVAQWVFLQAFDMEGLGSDIVFRLFSRNDNPPETGIFDFSADTPYVDGDPGGVVTGVKLNWYGSDPIDYPGGDQPPLEYQWRLYGPYPDSVFRQLVDSFVRPVWVSRDGFIYNLGDTVYCCDTLYGDTVSVTCDTIIVSPTVAASACGHLEDKFFVDDTNFINDTATFNKVADSSFDGIDPWVLETSDTIYNVYKYYDSIVEGTPADTTVQMWFIFWIRSRDDAYVADLVPTFDSFTVINPRYERDVAVIDFTQYAGLKVTLPMKKPPSSYWKKVVEKWDPNVVFNDSGAALSESGISADYLTVFKAGDVPLAMLLKHKVLILYDDNILSARFSQFSDNIYKAIDAGVNVWLTMRAPLRGDPNMEPVWYIGPGIDYILYFGATRMVYSAWWYHTYYEGERIEDFMGGYALDSVSWPNLDIDTALLHSRYKWGTYAGTEWPARGLPGVDWSVRHSATEALYLYKSFYGSDHPLGGNYNMEGNPVAHRFYTSLFRTVHFNFTPLAIDTIQMQIVIDSVLNWLYDPTISSPTSATRYHDAPTKLSVSEARERYWRRNEERAREREMLMLY